MSRALGVLALGLLSAPTLCGAAEFDPQLASPRLVPQAQIKAHLRDYTDRAGTMSVADRVQVAGTRWFDLKWQLNQMAQAGQELPDLSEFGLDRKVEGFYVIDVAKNPQWEMWDHKLALLENQEVFELHAKRLLERGFRARDIQVLQEYVTENRSQRAVIDAERSMIRSIAAHRSVSPRRKQTISAADAAAYVYQVDRTREEAKQRWAAGLLARLDEQRRRALASFYQELGGTIAFLPDADFDRNIAGLAAEMTSGVYEQQLLQREQELRQ